MMILEPVSHHNLIVIPARMQATRLPGKPLADIAGTPMIVHVWRRAVAANAGDVIVATDSGEIADAVTAAASALRQARLQRIPVPPVSAAFGLSSLADAYRVAELNTAARVAEGRRIVGKKIGLTAKAVQQQLGVDQPDFGVLFDDMEFLDGAEIPCERLIQPKVEAEVALVCALVMAADAVWPETSSARPAVWLRSVWPNSV